MVELSLGFSQTYTRTYIDICICLYIHAFVYEYMYMYMHVLRPVSFGSVDRGRSQSTNCRLMPRFLEQSMRQHGKGRHLRKTLQI